MQTEAVNHTQAKATTTTQADVQIPAKADTGGGYRGRIAPTPTGLLHLGHARTFHTAWQRARAAGGTLIYRQEDLDPLRCTPAYAQAALEDLRHFGLCWDEGPDCVPQGPHAPYCQSQRTALYRMALALLIRSGHAYPDAHSRSDLTRARASGLARPCPPLFGEQDSEAIFPPQWRPTHSDWFANTQARELAASRIEGQAVPVSGQKHGTEQTPSRMQAPAISNSAETDTEPAHIFGSEGVNWRFCVPDAERLHFTDGGFGSQTFTAGEDFGDFVLWRRDGVPAYELAVVVDDIAMGITEVVRGADLLRSTARQLLLYRALGAVPPAFFHCPLVLDPRSGERLAKRSQSLSLRTLLEREHKAGENQPRSTRGCRHILSLEKHSATKKETDI